MGIEPGTSGVISEYAPLRYRGGSKIIENHSSIESRCIESRSLCIDYNNRSLVPIHFHWLEYLEGLACTSLAEIKLRKRD